MSGRARRGTIIAGAVALVGTLACGGGPETTGTGGEAATGGTGGGGGGAVGCPPGERPGDEGCEPAGASAGVSACPQGFSADGDGCAPILPDAACPPGSMAVPGETTCRPVADCGRGPWGDIPDEPGAEWVEAGFAGESDGSKEAPWTTIGEAVAAAESGALIAVASGMYLEDVIVSGKPVRLRGRCPDEVSIVGAAEITIHIEDADGTEVAGLAISGPGTGVEVASSSDVVLENLWIHDTDLGGVAVTGAGASATLRGSLLEANTITGGYAFGATLVVESSAVRAIRSDGAGTFGWGLAAQDDGDAGAMLQISNSLVELCSGAGVLGNGSELVVDATVVRDTLAAGDGTLTGGVLCFPALTPGERGSLTLTRSVVLRSVETGVTAYASDAFVEDSTIRDVAESPSAPARGWGIVFHEDEATGIRSGGSVVESAVSGAHEIGIFDVGSAVTIERTVVADVIAGGATEVSHGISLAASINGPGRTLGWVEGSRIERVETGIFAEGARVIVEATLVRDMQREASGLGGRCVNVQQDESTLERGSATLRFDVLEDCLEIGLFAGGADLDVESTRISGGSGDALGNVGNGILAQLSPFGEPSTLSVRKSAITENRSAGIAAIGSSLVVEETLIEATAADVNQAFGDGIVASSYPGLPASAVVRRCVIRASDRAGVAAFGAVVELSESHLECNAIPINGEASTGPFAIHDGGGNSCACEGTPGPCQVLSAGLAPPEALP